MRKHSNKQQDGFTLLEVLVALGLFALITGGLDPAIRSNAKRNDRMERTTSAIHAAQVVLDDYRSKRIRDLPSSGEQDVETITIDQREYEVYVFICEDDEYCDAETRRLRVVVTNRSEELYETETLYTELR
jgi:prepilin-type N-terminal cleavage/methylation domain-containing protein